jgi:hypothetical protein
MELALGLRPQGRRTLEESPHVFDNPSRPLDYGAPIRRQLRPTGGPVEEIESDVRLEVPKSGARSRLRDPMRQRSLTDRPEVSDALEEVQRDQVWLRLRQGHSETL